MSGIQKENEALKGQIIQCSHETQKRRHEGPSGMSTHPRHIPVGPSVHEAAGPVCQRHIGVGLNLLVA